MTSILQNAYSRLFTLKVNGETQLYIDIIITKYKITTNTGEVLINTLHIDPMLRSHIVGMHFVDYDYTLYKSGYQGEQADCNQMGWVKMDKIDENSFKLWVILL
ncbi:hypothetical protein [Psychroflexus sp. MES1-P1E]|uniref:hypothetical protein n=1 Tax=Psychroflexus sp. MES1-P1E TaxID=2058320 RepID=UPI000C797063|nr:hypothetical protein [Psychroflexus sp. MES1-P1E]PKG41191.1 hypothetical protein CXF67_16515 [Psychroflexus sp. MES1-P1E]